MQEGIRFNRLKYRGLRSEQKENLTNSKQELKSARAIINYKINGHKYIIHYAGTTFPQYIWGLGQ